MWWISLLIIFLTPLTSFAYSESTTHPALTDEIIDLFNFYHPELKISDEYKELAKTGSTNEDDNIRMMHHFYDPVYNRGIELADTKWQSSKDWAQDTMGQASLFDQVFAGSLTSYFGSDADHSWDRAIYEYAWGDKERGIKDLGHILHLIEDASVPDHTRNDPHPPAFSFGSPYEAWTSQFDSEKLDGLAKSLYNTSSKSIIFSDLHEYFNSMANYSNNNFFSKDTIFHKAYEKPFVTFENVEKLSDDQFYKFGYDRDGTKLVLVGERKLGSKNISYSIEDPDEKILSDYWDRLSKQAVLHGAGVVKLFFDEVEKEKKTQALYNKNKSWFAKAYDATKNKIFGIAATLYGSSVGPDELAELNNSQSVQPPTLDNISSGIGGGASKAPASVESPTVRLDNLTPAINPTENTVNQSSFQITDFSNAEILGNDGVGGTSEDENFSSLNIQTKNVLSSVSDIQQGLGGPFNTPRVPPENDNISGSSPDVGSGSSSTTTAPDTTSPNISFSISQCSSSLSSDGCLVINSNLSISWSSSSTDLASYDVECSLSGNSCSGFSFSATSATSTNYSLPTDEKTYQFRARAKDTTGNISAWATISVEYYSNPVVINEIAWGGTSASAFDEWIELYNKSSKSVSLSNWVLYAQDLVPYINLQGSIPANGYYLIERTDDTTISDISADLIAEFSGVGGGSGISNTGEIFVLSKASTTIDQTPNCGISWGSCGGSSTDGNPSMERFDHNSSGSLTSNWGTSNNIIKRGKDANGTNLVATPKSKNSISYQIANGSTLSSNKTLLKSQNPYIVPTTQDFLVNSGVTLTIEPGVVIKMGDQSSIIVSGDIISSGTASDKITFTSIYDDSYEGDTNGDGSASLPVAGSWKYLRIQSPSINSQINYTRFKYGGRYFTPTALDARAMLSIYEATTTISNSIFEESQIAGLRATRFNGTIINNTFNTGTTTNTDKVGLFVYQGAPTISNNTFSNNYQGLNIELSQATSTISNSTFSNNYIGLYLTLAKVNLDTLSFTNNTAYGIQSDSSTISVLNPGNITFSGNGATTSPGGLF